MTSRQCERISKHVGGPEAGVAFLMVLTILAALMVLAVPFISIAAHENAASVAPLARARANDLAASLQAYARYVLVQGHEESELLLFGSGDASQLRATPGWDIADEANVPIDIVNEKGKPATDQDNVPYLHPLNSRGVTGDLVVRDESSLPNLLTSPPFLIAASLGRSTLSSDITGEDVEISVEDASGFPKKDGHILIDGELIAYGKREGGMFMECQRGLEGGLKPRKHRADAWVIDDRAREIAMLPWKSPRAKNGYREPIHPTYIKEIALLGRDALSPNEVDRLLRDFTVFGRRYDAGLFGPKIPIAADIDPAAYDGNGFVVQMRSITGLVPGTVVKISDGESSEYGMVARFRGQSFGRIWLHDPPERMYNRDRTSIQPLLRHPININSASRDALTRVVFGLQQGQNGIANGTNGRIEEGAAKIVVEGILDNRPVKDLKQFREMLDELSSGLALVFTQIQAVAVFRNAVDPGDRNLPSGTVPFCFQSFDYYTIESRAVVNDQSGRELARAGIRERVHVAPLGVIALRLDTQDDLDRPFYRARSGPWTTTHPIPTARFMSVTGQPYDRIPRMLYRFGSLGEMTARSGRNDEDEEDDTDFENGVFADKEEGDVRLLPARMNSSGYNQHFDGPAYFAPDPSVKLRDIDPEGYRLTRQPYEFNPRDQRGPQTPGAGRVVQVGVRVGGSRRGSRRGGQQQTNAGALQGRTSLNAVRFDLWYRTGGGGASRQVLFHYAKASSEEDEITLALESDGSLLGRVAGRTLEDKADAFEETAEVRWLPEDGASFWKPQTWYHLGLVYRGTKPDDLMLFVDGFAVGKPRYQTTLTGAITAEATSFEVEEGEGWPQQGVALVGTEVIAFERSGTSFDVIQFDSLPWGRGRRGTKVRPHAEGTVVTLFGYSTAPRGVDTRSGEAIPAGGGSINDGLGPMVAAKFESNATITVQVPAGGGLTIPVQIKVHDPKEPEGDRLKLIGDSIGGGNYDCFPQSGGYVVIVSRGPGLAGAPQGSIEFARYGHRNNDTLYAMQGVPNPPNPALAQLANDPNLAFYLDRVIHPVELVGTGPVPPIQTLSAVYPVSVAISTVSGYLTPQRPQGNQGAGEQVNNVPLSTWDTAPEFIQIGQPSTQSLEQHDIEWIRYHHIDKAGHLLCDEARFIIASALSVRSRHLANGNLLGASETLRATLPMRRQCGTYLFTDGNHSGGSEAVPCFRTVSHSRRAAINVDNYNAVPAAPVNGQRWSAAGWRDRVTIEGQRSANRRHATVSWAGLDEKDPEDPTLLPGATPLPNISHRPNYDGHGWIAFTESIGVAYRQRSLPRNGLTQQRDRYVRMLKFPSGEMPDIARGSRVFAGGTADGEVADNDAYIDELRVTPFQAQRYVLWDHEEMDLGAQPAAAQPGQPAPPPVSSAGAGGIDETTDEIPIANIEWMISNPTNFGPNPRFYILPDGRRIYFERELQGLPNNDAGLIRIDEEIIAFRRIGTGGGGGPALLDCERGLMNTIPARHGWGSNVLFLDFVQATMLSGALEANGPRLDVADIRGFFASGGGTVLIGTEMIHYTQVDQRSLIMPWKMNENGEQEGGLLRGRFGTQPQSWDTESIVFEMPFRYWDRYVEMQDSADLSWYGFGLDLPGAFIHQIEFDEYKPNEYVDIDVLVRTDPNVSWADDPKKVRGLFLFTDTEEDEPNLINAAGDGVSVRVQFKFLQGAFNSTNMLEHAWKSTPELRSLNLQYLDQTRVLSREAIR
ncbi:MAG: hypothetical protein CMJ83_13450 [Planctomycetes bacterium]|nr:hypothetical protein [Planctomycetota bacterium]